MLIRFKCEYCGDIIELNDLHDYLWREKEDEVAELCDEKGVAAIEVLNLTRAEKKCFSFDYFQAETVVTMNDSCKQCGGKLKYHIWAWFTIQYDYPRLESTYYLEQLDDFLVVDIEGAKLDQSFGISKGEEIWSAVSYFLYRWTYLKYPIFICVPFIDKFGWKKLLTHVFEMHYSNFLNNINIDKFIVRPANMTRESAIDCLRDIVNEKRSSYDEICESGIECPDCFWFNFENTKLYKSIKFSKDKFHCKIFAGKGSTTECILTSFNPIESEFEQLESYTLLTIPKHVFERWIEEPIVRSLIE